MIMQAMIVARWIMVDAYGHVRYFMDSQRQQLQETVDAFEEDKLVFFVYELSGSSVRDHYVVQ